MYKAQGTIEYLVILAVIVIISLVVVSLMSSTSRDSNVSSTSNKLISKVAPIAVTSVSVDGDGDAAITFQNNTGELVRYTSVTINGEEFDVVDTIVGVGESSTSLLEGLDICGVESCVYELQFNVETIEGEEKTITTEAYSNEVEDVSEETVLDDTPVMQAPPTENCGNSIDDDGDTLVDCMDSDCDTNSLCISGTTASFEWEKRINANSRAMGVAIDSDNNVIVTGRVLSGSYRPYVVKYDSSGNIVWSFSINFSGAGHDVVVDAQDNVYLTGYINQGSGPELLAAKYDSLGNLDWNVTVDDFSTSSEGNGIYVDSQNNVYVTGQGKNSIDELILYKFDSLGNEDWNTIINFDYFSTGEDLEIDSGGNIYVIGETSDNITSDLVLVKFDSLGNEDWNIIVDRGNNDSGYSIDMDSSNNIYVAGYSENGSKDELLLAKYNTSGVQDWNFIYNSSSSSQGLGVKVDFQNNIYVAGSDTGTSSMPLFKYDSSGNQDWNISYTPVFGTSTAYDVAVDSIGGVYIVGESDPTNPEPLKEFITVKYKQT